MPRLHAPSRVTSLVCALLAFAGCGEATLQLQGSLPGDEPFVRVARTSQALTADGGASGTVSAGNEHFYVAVHKSQLAQRWFLSAYLTQWHPSENLPVHSLGTRVVSFRVQNGKLFVFDATDGATWSDVLDPSVVVEAYPVVTDYAPFNALAGSSNYVLFDPAAGLNRFDVVGDSFAASYWARFQVDLTYLQRFRPLADGVSWEQVFTGYTEVPGPGILGWDQPFRGSGTMSVALRRYAEGPGFTPSELTSRRHFGSSNVQYVPNAARLKQYAVKWNLKPGMAPIPWRISKSVARLQADPRLAGVDVEGAIARGITGWNQAFGFPVFTVVPTGVDDDYGDDEKNFVVVDPNPGAGLAFANWRENPNTGEIRGASVYFSSVFVEGALQALGDAGVELLDAGAAGSADAGPATAPCSPNLVISQVFGGNSATGAYNQDFVELHNRTDAPVSLAGHSLQYGSATGTGSWQVVPLTGTVPAGGYYLVGFAATDGGVALPPVDQASGINLAASSGKVALVASTAALVGACPLGGAVLDAVGYGSANCSELRPAPAGSTAKGVLRADLLGCVDTNDNGADFVSDAFAPLTTASPPRFCTCAAPAAPLAPATLDGGTGLAAPTHLAAPTKRAAASLRWGGLQPQGSCALPKHLASVAVPAGMTRAEFLERSITHTILHEVGHVLGLRHNFKGSLEGSSVMDYLRDDDAARLDAPGAYDVAALRQLYGLSPDAPPQAFCTDEDTAVDAQCDRFDTTANPLTDDVAPRFTAKVRAGLGGDASAMTYETLWSLTRYVRGPASEAQRLEAFNALMADVAPPMPAHVTALGAQAEAQADAYAQVFLRNLFVDPATHRDAVRVNPAMTDPAFVARSVEVAKNILLLSDGKRSFASMLVMIDVLKAMQHPEALAALRSARDALAASRASWVPANQPLNDELVRRIDLACSPYFF